MFSAEINAFNNVLSDYFSTPCFCTTNGTSSIYCILSSIPRGTILAPAFGYPALINVALTLGFKVKLFDVNKENLVMDDTIINSITDDIVAISFISHGGMVPKNLQKVKQVCSEKNIVLIEDSSTCLGLKYEEKLQGTLCDFGIISFSSSTKIINADGGGVIIFNSDIAKSKMEYISKLIDMGGYSDKRSNIVGLNFLLSKYVISEILSKFDSLDKLLELRNSKISQFSTRKLVSNYCSFPMFLHTDNQIREKLKALNFNFRYRYYCDNNNLVGEEKKENTKYIENTYIDIPNIMEYTDSQIKLFNKILR